MDFIDFRLPAEGFAQPLMLWLACHQRGQRVALLLQRLLAHLREHGPSEATRVTAAEVGRYLEQAAPRHHDDEEIDLFPRLRRRLDVLQPGLTHFQVSSTVRALDRLQRDHGELDALTAEVQSILRHADRVAPDDAQQATVARFIDGYLIHHGTEDELIAPVAQLALQPQDLADIGEAMAARRGTRWSALAARA
jgi:hemerythrin-like domain-containing protein